MECIAGAGSRAVVQLPPALPQIQKYPTHTHTYTHTHMPMPLTSEGSNCGACWGPTCGPHCGGQPTAGEGAACVYPGLQVHRPRLRGAPDFSVPVHTAMTCLPRCPCHKAQAVHCRIPHGRGNTLIGGGGGECHRPVVVLPPRAAVPLLRLSVAPQRAKGGEGGGL